MFSNQEDFSFGKTGFSFFLTLPFHKKNPDYAKQSKMKAKSGRNVVVLVVLCIK